MNNAVLPELKRNVVLVGLMGAGKSTIGRRLAECLGLDFVDADQEIEAAAGCTVPEFFERHGEDEFRKGERRVIARLLERPTHVLATGGGAFMDPDTRAATRQHGVSVWLRADLDTLTKRARRRNDRPLLQRGDPRAVLESLMATRYPVYAEADITIDSADGSHDDVVDEIIARLRESETAMTAPETS